MPSSPRVYIQLLIMVLALAVLGAGGWWTYQKNADTSKETKTATDTVTPKVKEAYKSSLDAGLKYVVATGEKQVTEDAALDSAAGAVATLVGQKYGIGSEDQFRSIYRVHYDIASKYYQALVANDRNESERQLLSLNLWADQISSLTPVENSDNIRTLYKSYVEKLAAFVRASASKQGTDALKSDLETSQRQLAEGVASAIR